jgi:hypothetical protein
VNELDALALGLLEHLARAINVLAEIDQRGAIVLVERILAKAVLAAPVAERLIGLEQFARLVKLGRRLQDPLDVGLKPITHQSEAGMDARGRDVQRIETGALFGAEDDPGGHGADAHQHLGLALPSCGRGIAVFSFY